MHRSFLMLWFLGLIVGLFIISKSFRQKSIFTIKRMILGITVVLAGFGSLELLSRLLSMPILSPLLRLERIETNALASVELVIRNTTLFGHAAGIAPIAPVDPDGLKAMGKTNDAVLFGGRTYYYVESEEGDDIKDVAEKLPSASSDGFGKPFYDVFKEAEFDFYKIDKGMFAPAEVVINDLRTGEMFRAGAVNVELLKKSFGI